MGLTSTDNTRQKFPFTAGVLLKYLGLILWNKEARIKRDELLFQLGVSMQEQLFLVETNASNSGFALLPMQGQLVEKFTLIQEPLNFLGEGGCRKN